MQQAVTLCCKVLLRTEICATLYCAAKYYSGTTLYYKVLLRYYSVLQSTTRVLQSTTPVLACTAKYYSSTTLYYSSTTLYYKVLLQYYSALQSATKYYTSTTLYDNLLLQYYSVLQSTATYYRITYEMSFTLRGATRVSLQLHQILRLPRKMVLMIDVPHIWNVIYNARSNKHHPPTSPNTAPATLHDSHDWSSWHMKHHLQCAEQQASPSNLTKYCACHEKWCASSVVVTYETSFTMRGATGITLQPHQILCLPRKMMRIIGCRDSWNVIYNARSNRHHPPTSPNTAPATKNDAHHWSSSHMKRHLQCAEQQASPSNLTKYCTCHAKWLSWLMSVTYETSFTMRGATSITLQPHQILRLPRKIAFQNLREIVRKQLKCHLQCAADSSMIRTWSEHDPTMNSSSRTRPFAEVTFRASKTHFVMKITTFRAPAIYPDFTEYCACHEKWHSKITKYCTCHEKWFSWLISVTYETSFTMRGATSITLQPHSRLKRQFQCAADSTMIRAWSEHDPSMIRPWTRHLAPARSPRLLFALRRRILYWKLQHFALRLSTQIWPNTVPATKNDTPTSPNAAPATKSDTPRSPNTAPATKSSTPRSPNAAPATKSQLLLSCYSTELLLSCYSTEPLLNCYWTELNLLLNWAVTELLLKWAVTELLLNWAVTELLLNWAEPVTQLSCYWTVTQVSCYWTVTQLSCYWTVTQVSCYWTELLLHF